MKRLCLILICLILSQTSYANARNVRCEGNVDVIRVDRKKIDAGVVRVVFQMIDDATMRDIKVVSKFKKMNPQTLEAYESRALQRAVASGKFRGDFFPLGENGACQMGLGYQGDLVKKTAPVSSWSIMGMNCGSFAVSGNLKCQMK